MKLLIYAGHLNKLQVVEELAVLYQSANLVIQGNDIKTIPLDDGRQAFLAGHLVGRRTRSNDILACDYGSTGLAELIQTNSLEQCQDLLEGRFLLIIAGPDDKCLVCADRYSQLDLYYQVNDDQHVLASDLSLLPVSPAKDGFDQIGLAHALTIYGYRPAKRHTYYKGVRRLGVREIVTIKHGQVHFSDSSFNPVRTSNFGPRELNQYADLFLDTIRIRGSSYGNVVYLSSGWDSTAILAGLVHVFGARKVRAVIGRLQYAQRSGIINQFEIDRARAVADYYGIHLDIVEFDYRQDGAKWFEQLGPLFKSQQFAGPTAINQHILADFVARTTPGDEVIFAGEISDGVHNLGFSQFVTIFHPVLEFREYSDKMASYLFGPTFLGLLHEGDHADDVIYGWLKARAGGAIFEEPAAGDAPDRTRQLLASFFLRSNRFPLWSMRNSQMLSAQGATEYSAEMEQIYLEQAAQMVTPETLYSWYIHLYNSFHWQGATVAPLSATAAAQGLNMALPFWDSRLQEFLAAMPESWGRGLDLNPTKYPLKWMLQNRIDYPIHLQVGPHSYLYDVDHTFSHSAELMYGSAFNPYLKEALRQRVYQDILSADMFNLDYIDGIVDGFFKDVEVRGSELSDLITLAMISATGWYS